MRFFIFASNVIVRVFLVFFLLLAIEAHIPQQFDFNKTNLNLLYSLRLLYAQSNAQFKAF